MKNFHTGCEAPCRQNALYTSTKHLTAVSVQFIPAHMAPPVVNATPCSPRTHTLRIIFLLSLSQPPTLSHEGPECGFTSVCAILWCDISPRACTWVLPAMCECPRTEVCASTRTTVKRSKCISLASGFLSAPCGGELEIP